TSRFVYVLTFFSAIGGFLFGYDTGVVSGAMIILKQKFSLNNFWQASFMFKFAITVGFAAIFALLGGPLNSVFGRRRVIMAASFVFMGGSVVLALSGNKETLLVGRAIVGVGISLVSMTVPMYIAEVAPTNVRGRLVSVNNLFITGGQFVASCVDGLFSSDVENGWRYMLGLAAIPAFIQFFGFIFLPESPRWLLQKDQDELAKKCLLKVATSWEVRREFEAIKNAILEERLHGRVFLWLSYYVAVRRAIVIGCALQLFQQISGINTVINGLLVARGRDQNHLFASHMCIWPINRHYSQTRWILIHCICVVVALLFLSTGFFLSALHSPPVLDNSTSILNDTSACYRFKSCVNCMQAPLCGYCYTQVGQSWNVTQSTCLPTNVNNPQLSKTGECSSKHPGSPYFASNYCPTQYSWMAMAGMVLYLAFFAPEHDFTNLCRIQNSEITNVIAGNAFSAATNWVFNVVISLTFLDVTTALTYQGAFLLYAGFAFTGVVFIYLFLPETKGKPLEEVQQLFQS
uniref:Major facilitator superfamily (MFS) profile domain-containing protein n=1 Tax=Ciona savignyi TaxID=51511 RepID=H2Z8X3_CIOSA